MRRYLVVANQTLMADHLLEKVEACLAEGECEFHLVVPATPPTRGFTTEGQERAAAEGRLHDAIIRYKELGADHVSGEVEVANPVHAVGNVLRHRVADEIIVSTLPRTVSKWIGQDAVSRMRRAYPVRITHVVEDRVHAHR